MLPCFGPRFSRRWRNCEIKYSPLSPCGIFKNVFIIFLGFWTLHFWQKCCFNTAATILILYKNKFSFIFIPMKPFALVMNSGGVAHDTSPPSTPIHKTYTTVVIKPSLGTKGLPHHTTTSTPDKNQGVNGKILAESVLHQFLYKHRQFINCLKNQRIYLVPPSAFSG